jgi:hypothetical protein
VTSAWRCAGGQWRQDPAEEVERLRAQVLRNLIDETLQIQEAKTADITIDEAEVDATLRASPRKISSRTPRRWTPIWPASVLARLAQASDPRRMAWSACCAAMSSPSSMSASRK